VTRIEIDPQTKRVLFIAETRIDVAIVWGVKDEAGMSAIRADNSTNMAIPKVDPKASPTCRKVATDADADPSRLLSVVANIMLPEVVSIIAVPQPINVNPMKIMKVGSVVDSANPEIKTPAISVILPTSHNELEVILVHSQPVTGEQIGRMPCKSELNIPVLVAE